MKKFILLSLVTIFAFADAGLGKKLKKLKKVTKLKAAVHVVKQAVHVVDSTVTKPIVNNVVKPVVHETKGIVNTIDTTITKSVVNTVVKPVIDTIETPVQQLIKPLDQTQKFCLPLVKKEISSIEKLTLKPFKVVEHELSKVAQKNLDNPLHFFSDILVDIQKELVDHTFHEVMKLDNNELHVVFKGAKMGSKVFKGAFLLASTDDLFEAVIHYFLPLPITGIVTASEIIDSTHAIDKLTKHYNAMIDKLESTNDDISVTHLDKYATLLMKHQLTEERDNSVMLLTLTKDIGKGIEDTIHWIDEHRVQVPNKPIGHIDLTNY